MATVPDSGSLSQLAMAQEALHGTYGSGSITGPISLYDMVNGGNTNGSGNSYPTVNQACLPNPADRGSYVPLFGIIKFTQPNTYTGPFTFYLDPSEAATASALSNGDTIYSDAALTTTIPAHGIGTGNHWLQNNSYTGGGDQNICPVDEGQGAFDTNSSGVVSSFDCSIP
jgi:hypothetical protein